jgi:DNA-binding beta-propeller fold protein YncE
MTRRNGSMSRHTFSVAIALLAVAAMFLAAAAAALGAPGGRDRFAWLDPGSGTARASSSPWAAWRHGPLGAGASLVGATTVAPGPSAVALDATTHTVYVVSGNNPDGPSVGTNAISVIDARRCNVRAVSRCAGPWPTITVPDVPSALAVDAATDTLYVTTVDDNAVAVIDGTTCNARVTSGCGQAPVKVPVGAAPLGIYADARDHTVYVADFDDDTVSMIDSATCNGRTAAGCPAGAAPSVAVGNGPGDIDTNPTTHTAYVTTLAGLSVFDARTCNATRQTGCTAVGQASVPSCLGIPTSLCGPFAAKVDVANNTIYEAGGTNTVWVFDGRRCRAGNLAGCAAETPGAFAPFPQPGFEVSIAVALDERLHSVYVAYHKDDALMVIDADRCNGRHLAACATLGPREIHTGTNPESVALDPSTQTLYTADELDGTVSVIDASLCSAAVTRGCRPRVPEVAIPGVPTADGDAAGAPAADDATETVYVPGPTGVTMLDSRRCNAWRSAGCAAGPPTVLEGTQTTAIAVDVPSHTVYVADAAGRIAVLEDRSCNASRQTGCASPSKLDEPGGAPFAIAINSFTHTLYAATVSPGGVPSISVFDAATCNAGRRDGCDQTPAHIALAGDGPADVAINRSTNTLYATSLVGNTVSVIDGATCDATDTSGCSAAPATVTLSSTGSTDANPAGIAVVEATNTVYTANLSDGEFPGSVSVIDGATCNGRDTSGCGHTPAIAPTGFGTKDIAADPTTHDVYTANDEDTSVTRIDGDTCRGGRTDGCDDTRTRPIVGDYPRAIGLAPTVHTAYVSDQQGVSVLRLRR